MENFEELLLKEQGTRYLSLKCSLYKEYQEFPKIWANINKKAVEIFLDYSAVLLLIFGIFNKLKDE